MTLLSFYRFCVSDFLVQVETVRSSIRHDLRYARYLHASAPVRQRSGLFTLALSLERLDLRLTKLVLDPLRELAGNAELSRDVFLSRRAELTRIYRLLIEQLGVTVGDLEAFAARLPPGVVVGWTRLEASDATPVRTLVKVAKTVFESLKGWRLTTGAAPGDPLVAVEFAFQDDVYAYDDLPQDAAGEPALRRMAQAVVVPIRVAFSPRYGPALVVHEVCHGWVRWWLRQTGWDQHRALYRAATRALFRPDHQEALIDTCADDAFVETLVDELSLRLLGPTYVLTFAAWTFGRVASRRDVGFDDPAPFEVRLRRLCDHPRVLAAAEPLAGALRAIRDHLTQVEAERAPVERAYRDALLRLLADPAWLPASVYEGAPERIPVGPQLDELWRDALNRFEAEPTTDTLAALDECRQVDELREGNRWPEGVIEPPGETWRLLFVHVAGALPETPRDLALVQAALNPDHAERGVVRMAVGPCDAVALLPDARVWRKDNIECDPLTMFVERHLGAAVTRVPGFDWSPRDPDPHETAVLLELALAERIPSVIVTRLLEAHEARPVLRVFRGFGWAHLFVLVAVKTPAELQELCAELRGEFRAPDGRMETVTDLQMHILVCPQAPASEPAGRPVRAVTTITGQGAGSPGRLPVPASELLTSGADLQISRDVSTWRELSLLVSAARPARGSAHPARVVTRLYFPTATSQA